MQIFDSIITALWLILLAYWMFSAVSAKKTIRNGRWGSFFLFRTFLLIAIVVAFHTQISVWTREYRIVETVNPVLGVIGTLLVAAGVAFAIWARVHLGKNWGMPMSHKAEPDLVTSGPYAYVRHPIYTGVLLASLGSAIVIGPLWLVLFFVLGAYFIYSAKIEERNLSTIFPSQYPDYKKRTKMLIPFVF